MQNFCPHRLTQCKAWTVLSLLATVSIAAEEAAAENVAAEAAAVVVSFEGVAASRLPLAEIREALAEELRRPMSDQPDPELARITIAMDGAERVIVRYQPPPGELERSVVLPEGTGGVAALVSVIAKELVYRDAGLTLPGELPRSDSQPSPTAAAAPAAPPSDDAAAPVAGADPRAESGPTFSAMTRVGGFAIVTTGGGRGNADLSLGGSLRVELPFTRRFSVGTELGLLSFQTGFLPGNGWDAEVDRATYLDVSVVPSFLLAKLGPSTEARLAVAVGLTLPLAVRGTNLGSASDAPGDGLSHSYSGEAGYRLAILLGGTHWLDDRWGITAALGVEHHFTVSTRAELLFAGPVQRDMAKIWSSEPMLQLGASLRF